MGVGVGVGVGVGAKDGVGVVAVPVLPELLLLPVVPPEFGVTTTICGSIEPDTSTAGGSSALSLLVSQKQMSATASRKNTMNKTAANLPFFIVDSVLSLGVITIIQQKAKNVYYGRRGQVRIMFIKIPRGRNAALLM